MSSGLRGDISTLARFSAKLSAFPRVIANKVAAAAAPALTAVAQGTFSAGETAYGVGWQPKVDGDRATLNVTGSLARGIQYVAIGTLLRVRLAVDYAKYQVGKRPVFPTQGSPLPAVYRNALAQAAADVIRAEVRAA